VSDRVRSGPAVGEHLCPIRARVPVGDGRLTAVRPLRFAGRWRPRRATFCALVALVPPRPYARGSGRRSFLVRRCSGDDCPSSGLYGPVRSGQVRLGVDSDEPGLVRLSCGLWNDSQNGHLVKQSRRGPQRAVRPADHREERVPVLFWIRPNKRQPTRQGAHENASARGSGGSPPCRAALCGSPTNKP
jgi:hypothetical protein